MTCGIYRIYNKIDGKSYIGSSNDVSRRLSFHYRKLSLKLHHNVHLQRAWNIYGADNFCRELVEECEQSQLLKREKFWIDHYIDGLYNICKEPEVTNLGVRRSEEFKSKVSSSLLGRKRPKDVCERISEGQRKRWNSKEKQPYVFGVEPIQLVVHKKVPKSFKSPTGQIYENINNLTEFCKEYGLVMQRMSDVFLGKLESHRGFTRL